MRGTTTKWTWIPALAMAAFLAGCGGAQTDSAETTEAPAATSAAEDHGHEHPNGSDHPIELAVTKDGFEPKEVRVKAGQPVTLAVTRKTDRTCATELVLKEYGINQKLPLNETVQIQFTPTQSGPLTYACAMDMIKGTIVVE